VRDEESEDKAHLGHREDDDVYPRDDSGASPSAPSRASGGLRAPLLPEPAASAASAASARRRVLLVAAALSAANGGTRLALAILETVGPSVFYALWADAHPLATDAVFLVHQTASPLDAFLLLVGRAKPPASASPAAVHAGALFWGGVGGLGLVAFAFMYVASRRGASDRALLAIGAALCAAGCALAASADAAAGGPASRLLRFQAGICLAWGVGFPLAQAAAVAALAKSVPPARLGAAMAAQAMAGSLGRVVGPLLAGSLYDGRGGARALVAAGAAAAAAAALVAAMWRTLRPR
jgi:MFS family permease